MKTRRDTSQDARPGDSNRNLGVAPTHNHTRDTNQDARLAHVYAVDRHASSRLVASGFGAPRAQSANSYATKGWIPVKWPKDLWYRADLCTQQGDLHIEITDDQIALRVHIDLFHGDRPSNEAAFDIIRGEIEHDLLAQLPVYDDIDWRAAGGARGDNQVCVVAAHGGFGSSDPQRDADWVVAAARAWQSALERHHIRDLRQRVEGEDARQT